MAVTLKDIAITGFNDIPPAQHSHPSLTTVHQPIYHIGCMISDMLTKCRVSTANPWQNVTCSCRLPWSSVVPSAAEAGIVLTRDCVVFSQQMRELA